MSSVMMLLAIILWLLVVIGYIVWDISMTVAEIYGATLIRKEVERKTGIVRCKDCVHHQDCEIEFVAQASTKFYCSYGERKDT